MPRVPEVKVAEIKKFGRVRKAKATGNWDSRGGRDGIFGEHMFRVLRREMKLKKNQGVSDEEFADRYNLSAKIVRQVRRDIKDPNVEMVTDDGRVI
ncbi:hypothetical protein IAT38_007093 [Cryptococcus sp. DSM 104549]